jgi:transposase
VECDAGLPTKPVAEKFSVSTAWVRRLKQRRETGQIAPRQQRHGRRAILADHLETLAGLVREQLDATAKELASRLPMQVSHQTVQRTLQQLRVTYKKGAESGRTGSSGCGAPSSPLSEEHVASGSAAVGVPG